jgi:indolepyruvate ferredoxin oxidoreductase beta subunit
VLPLRLARAIIGYSEKRGWLGTVYFGMELKTTTVWGYLRFWGLAKLKPFRPKSWRFAEEQAAIEAWLARVAAAAKLSAALAREVAECARLIKGYGDTWKRGFANYQTIEARVIAPVLEGRIPLRAGIDAVASVRTAALLDPEGEGLAKALAPLVIAGLDPAIHPRITSQSHHTNPASRDSSTRSNRLSTRAANA